jgi:leucyl aminopeptidase
MSTVKTPTFLAREARKLAHGKMIRCEVWQGERLRKERMNGILAVSAGSKEPGAFIRLTYRPVARRERRSPWSARESFDSGGLS